MDTSVTLAFLISNIGPVSCARLPPSVSVTSNAPAISDASVSRTNGPLVWVNVLEPVRPTTGRLPRSKVSALISSNGPPIASVELLSSETNGRMPGAVMVVPIPLNSPPFNMAVDESRAKRRVFRPMDRDPPDIWISGFAPVLLRLPRLATDTASPSIVTALPVASMSEPARSADPAAPQQIVRSEPKLGSVSELDVREIKEDDEVLVNLPPS